MGVCRQILIKKQAENKNKAIMMMKSFILFSLLVAVIVAQGTPASSTADPVSASSTADPVSTTSAAPPGTTTSTATTKSTASSTPSTNSTADPENSSSTVAASWLLVASMILYNYFTLNKN